MKFLKEHEKEIYDFILNYNKDAKFREEVDSKYINEPVNLSILEIYALEEILREGNNSYFIKFVNYLKKRYGMDEITSETLINNYGYNLKNTILTDNESDIKKTLNNLLFGELIFCMLDRNEFKEIKYRQKEPGMIANIDKSIVIEELQRGFNYNFENVDSIVNGMYDAFIRFGGVESNYFKRLLKYNTNISFVEIRDIKNVDISKQKGKQIKRG